MPRLMSVALTEPQVRDKTKRQTRRLGWKFLKPGDRLELCRKVMGRGVDEPLVRLTEVVVTEVRVEPLNAISADDVAAEGFPDWTPAEFVRFFCEHMRCVPDIPVTVISWRYHNERGA